jgi:hypothetical protein
MLLSAFSCHQHYIRLLHPPTMNPLGNHCAGNRPEAFVLAGKDIQRKSPRIGAVSTEDRAFRKFFGTTAVVTSTLWRLLAANDKIPAESCIKHLLWMLHFLRAYLKQGATCSMVGGLEGAVDPKTLRKYSWPLIYTVSDMEPDVVSVFNVRTNMQSN